MGCSSSSQLVPIDDTQQTIQTDVQQCVLPTNTNNKLEQHSDTAVSSQSTFEEDALDRNIVPKECSDVSKKLNTGTKDTPIQSNLSTAGEAEIPAENYYRGHSKASVRLIKIQEEAKPESNEQMLRDKRVVTEFKCKQQLKLKANSENNRKEKIKRDIIAARDFRNSQKQAPESNIIMPADSNVTTDVVDGIRMKEEQIGQVRTSLYSLLDDSYDSSEEPIVIENDKCFNQDTDNFWEDSLHPDLLDAEAPGSVITM